MVCHSRVTVCAVSYHHILSLVYRFILYTFILSLRLGQGLFELFHSFTNVLYIFLVIATVDRGGFYSVRVRVHVGLFLKWYGSLSMNYV